MQDAIRGFAVSLALLGAAAGGLAEAAERVQTATGTVSRLDSARQTVVVKVADSEMTFVWNDETRINGVLAPGARVTLRYAAQPDGRNLAYQISVGR